MTALGTRSQSPIAVIGATGLQGGATARALLGATASVRALTRRPDSDAARGLAALGADVVPIDLDEPAGLAAAFAGVRAVFAMTTPGYEQRPDLEVTHGHAIADAAAAAGVPHVVYSSVGGAERHTGIPHFDSKRDVEEYLIAQGLSDQGIGTPIEDPRTVAPDPARPGSPIHVTTEDRRHLIPVLRRRLCPELG